MELLMMKSIIQEVKTSLESIKSRLDHTKNWNSDVEDRIAGLVKSIMKTIIQEIKISLESIKSRLDQTENQISNVEERIAGLEKSTIKTENCPKIWE